MEEVKKLIKKFIRLGYSKSTIISLIKKNNSDLNSSIVNELVDDIIAEYPNYGIIQKIIRSDLVCDKSGESDLVYMLDKQHRSVDSIHLSRIKELFDSKYDFKSRIYTANFDYRPLTPELLIKNTDGTYTYNTYVPPEWQKDYFYSNGKIKIDNCQMPSNYDRFIRHLVNNHLESYQYIIDWLANGIKHRNYCILTTIGKQGIGKGLLGEIMRRMFGNSNYYAGSDRMFKGTFNSQIANRRLVYCDEIFIQTKEDEDRIKLVVNDNIEIEKKRIDAKEVVNYSNFYVSSNNMDSITLTADDRRFSIVELTDAKLIDSFTTKDIDDLLDQANVNMFARHLWNLEIDRYKMLKVFVSERTEEVRSSSLKEWEEFFVFSYCPERKGKSIDIVRAGEDVKEQFGYSIKIGRSRFQDLSSKYPNIFKVKKIKNSSGQKWVIDISE